MRKELAQQKPTTGEISKLIDELIELFPAKMKRLDGQRRLIAIIIIFIGLWTFFAPTITTDPSVLGRTLWSPLDILTEIHDGGLPIHAENDSAIAGVEIHFVGSYLLLLLALLTVTSIPLPKLTAVSAFLGALFSLATDHRYGGPNDFWYLFYGSMNSAGGHVHLGEHILILLAVNLLLLGIVLFQNRN